MEGLASYVTADPVNREKHGLEVGDKVTGGFGPTVEVVEIDDEGVKLSDGSTASHNTVCCNMSDWGEL